MSPWVNQQRCWKPFHQEYDEKCCVFHIGVRFNKMEDPCMWISLDIGDACASWKIVAPKCFQCRPKLVSAEIATRMMAVTLNIRTKSLNSHSRSLQLPNLWVWLKIEPSNQCVLITYSTDFTEWTMIFQLWQPSPIRALTSGAGNLVLLSNNFCTTLQCECLFNK